MLSRYQSVFETTLDGIILINHRGIIEDINSAGIRLFGYDKDELLGKNVSYLMPEPHQANHDGYIANYQKTKKPKIIGIGREVEGKKKDGTLFPFRLAVSEFENLGEQFFTGIIHDLTQQKLHEKIITNYAEELENRVHTRTIELQKEIELKETAQKALIESQRLYETIAKNYPNGTISVIDRGYKTIFLEGSELDRLGIDKEEIYHTDYRENIPKEHRSQVTRVLKEALEGKAGELEYGSSPRVYRVRCVPISYTDYMVDQVLIVENNITSQKLAEQEMYAALSKEKQLNELKTNFVSMASHEFRTPLSSILSSANLIARYSLTEQQPNRQKHLDKIVKNVQSLTMILNDFLSLEKIEGGYVKFHPEKVDIRDFLTEVIEEAGALTKPNQKIITSYVLNSDSAHIDTYLLRNTLTNLLSNAIKYSEADVKVEVSRDENLKISVSDKGIGISSEDQEQLFSRFYRASNAGQVQGTGLGLNIVKRYVDIMGGEITFESRLDYGSTFSIILNQKQNGEK